MTSITNTRCYTHHEELAIDFRLKEDGRVEWFSRLTRRPVLSPCGHEDHECPAKNEDIKMNERAKLLISILPWFPLEPVKKLLFVIKDAGPAPWEWAYAVYAFVLALQTIDNDCPLSEADIEEVTRYLCSTFGRTEREEEVVSVVLNNYLYKNLSAHIFQLMFDRKLCIIPVARSKCKPPVAPVECFAVNADFDGDEFEVDEIVKQTSRKSTRSGKTY